MKRKKMKVMTVDQQRKITSNAKKTILEWVESQDIRRTIENKKSV